MDFTKRHVYMSYLKKLGIIKNETKASEAFENAISESLFEKLQSQSPSAYVNACWLRYSRNAADGNGALNGNVFELIIYTLLYKEGVAPFYVQASMTFVPNVEYDVIIYNKVTPVSLSLKVSLRERYKQADLEAVALKYVHRKAKAYLLTMNEDEAKVQTRNLADGKMLGLDKIIYCGSSDLDDLIKELKKLEFTESDSVQVVTGRLIKKG